MKTIALLLLVILPAVAMIYVAVSLVKRYIEMKREGTSYEGQSVLVYGYCLLTGVTIGEVIILIRELLQ